MQKAQSVADISPVAQPHKGASWQHHKNSVQNSGANLEVLRRMLLLLLFLSQPPPFQGYAGSQSM